MLPINPYIAGNPVGGSPAFVGRADVLREALRVLRHPQQNALVLYGQRRIGKTSVLQQLAAQLPREGNYCAVYFDLQDKTAWPLGRVLQDLARTAAHALGQPDPDLGDDAETAFQQTWLPGVLRGMSKDVSLVLLFDEFDVLADPKAGQAAAAFFPYLRKLLAVDPQRLQFVFVIGRNVTDLSSIALSLFKDIPARRVSLLSRQDTFDLVRLAQKNGTLDWTDGALERVWQLSHGHPFLTQQVCWHVWERAYDQEPAGPPVITPAEVEAAIPDALEASRNMMEWLWSGLPPAERVVISALAEAGPGCISPDDLERVLRESGVRVVIRELQNAPQLLQDWDFIEPADDGGGGYRFRVELLRQWIAQHKPLRRVQEELDRIEPVAENLYQAALGSYHGGQLEQAENLLRQALGLNPNHIKTNDLLAEILLAQDRPAEARQLLERLHEYQPSAARPRLVQAILDQAGAAQSIDERLALYEHALKLEPGRPEAIAALQRIQQLDHVSSQVAVDKEFGMYRSSNFIETKEYQTIKDKVKQQVSCFIFGFPYMGKTKLLAKLEADFNDQYNLVSVDTPSSPGITNFWSAVYERVVQPGLKPQSIEQALKEIEDCVGKANKPYLFLIDEIDRLFTGDVTDLLARFKGLSKLGCIFVATSYRSRQIWRNSWAGKEVAIRVFDEVFAHDVILLPWNTENIDKFLQHRQVPESAWSIKPGNDLPHLVLEQTGGIPRLVDELVSRFANWLQENWERVRENGAHNCTLNSTAQAWNLALNEVQEAQSLFSGFWKGVPETYQQNLFLACVRSQLKEKGEYPLTLAEFDRVVGGHFESPGEIGSLVVRGNVTSNILKGWIKRFVIRSSDQEQKIAEAIIQKVLSKNLHDSDALANYFEWVGILPRFTLKEDRKSHHIKEWNNAAQRIIGFALIGITIFGILRLLGLL